MDTLPICFVQISLGFVLGHQTWRHDAFMQKTACLVIEWLDRNAASLGFGHRLSLSFVYFVFDCPSLLSVIYLFFSLFWFIFSYSLPAFSLGHEIHVLGIWWRAVSTNVLKRNECAVYVSCSVWWECCSNTDSCHVSYVCHCVQCVTRPVSSSNPLPPLVHDGQVIMPKSTSLLVWSTSLQNKNLDSDTLKWDWTLDKF